MIKLNIVELARYLGVCCIILVFAFVGLFLREWPMKQELLFLGFSSAIVTFVFSVSLDFHMHNIGEKRKQLLLKEFLQLHQLLCLSCSDGKMTNTRLSVSEVQSLFSQYVHASSELPHLQAGLIPTVERYSVLKDICEESWFWLSDKFHSGLHLALHTIIYYFSFLLRPVKIILSQQCNKWKLFRHIRPYRWTNFPLIAILKG